MVDILSGAVYFLDKKAECDSRNWKEERALEDFMEALRSRLSEMSTKLCDKYEKD